MRCATLALLVATAAVGCDRIKLPGQPTAPAPQSGPGGAAPAAPQPTLAEARKGFVTKLPPAPAARKVRAPSPPPVFNVVRYESPVGKLVAYVTADPKDGKKRPAIVWVTGGDCNSIGDMWTRQPAKDDQTAAQYRDAGVVLMVPSLRGGNENPGRREFYLGELDDVVAAAAYLRTLPHVDPDRVYLGGHSTGGTVALMAACYTDTFRAVFAFGPTDDIAHYPPQYAGIDRGDPKEVEIRSPRWWLGSVRTPTFVVEGQRGNIESLEQMHRSNTNPKVTFVAVRGADHFNILAPLNRMLAQKILADTGPACAITLSADEAVAAAGR